MNPVAVAPPQGVSANSPVFHVCRLGNHVRSSTGPQCCQDQRHGHDDHEGGLTVIGTYTLP
jgi:hypothetical protein